MCKGCRQRVSRLATAASQEPDEMLQCNRSPPWARSATSQSRMIRLRVRFVQSSRLGSMHRFAAPQLDWCISSQRTDGVGGSSSVTATLDFSPLTVEVDPEQRVHSLVLVEPRDLRERTRPWEIAAAEPCALPVAQT